MNRLLQRPWLRWCIPVWLLVVASTAVALQPPSAQQLRVLRQDPVAFAKQVESAKRFGNHKVAPELAKRTALKLKLAAEGKDVSRMPPPAWRGMPTSGTNNVLVFLIDFPDEVAVNSYDSITNKLFGAGIPADFPIESLAKFYERSSYGLLHLKGSALGWYRMAHNRDWYTDTYGTGNEANYAIIQEVVDHFDATIDYRQFDNNGDGAIDYFAVLWAGPDNGWANFWWGYQWELQQNLTRDGVQFSKFSWQWESNADHSPTHSTEYDAGVIIHETGHALGLPDYYDYQWGQGPDGGVGGMDMMHAGNCDHNCFSKWMLDWISPTVVTTMARQLPLRAAADYPEAVAMAKNFNGASAFAEYFMIQNRQQVNNDLNLPGSGLTIWHIDARLDGAGNDFQFDNSYTAHKLLRLMEADGLEQIEAGGNANAGDFYTAGKVFADNTTPNSKFYDGSSSSVRVSAIGGGSTIPADYSVVGDEFVLPSAGFVSAGEPAVGPYLPSNKTYSVVNPLTSNLTWTVSGSGVPWLTIAPSSFDVATGAVVDVVLSINQNVATGMEAGIYFDDVTFTNNAGLGCGVRRVVLRIGKNYALQATNYNWIDPVAESHYAVNAPSGVSASYALPFPVTFYDAVYSNLYVSARGMVGFVADGLNETNNASYPAIESPNAVLCPFWDNIDGRRPPARMYYKVTGEQPDRKIVVTWVGVPHNYNLAATFSFQAIIQEQPTNALNPNNDIVFQYKDVAEADLTVGSAQSATVAIEDQFGGLYKAYSTNGSRWLANSTALLFTQSPVTDMTPPVGHIRALSGVGPSINFEITFSEPVEGLAVDDLFGMSTVPGVALGTMTGAGMRFLVPVNNITTLGRITMGVVSNAVADWAGNSNAAFGPAVYVVPLLATNFSDTMEDSSVNWTTSTNVFDQMTMVAWEWGVPDYMNGPAGAASGSHCWGTVLTGDYPNGMNAWVQSSPIEVGENPVLEFKEWHAFQTSWGFDADFQMVQVTNDAGYVEVDGGSGWVNVTPGGAFAGNGPGWQQQQIVLDNTQFGSRLIKVRFRATSDFDTTMAGLYVDDVLVRSERAPGVWVIDCSPTNATPPVTVPVSFTVYNSFTSSVSQVKGDVSVPYAGAEVVTSSVPVVYGDMEPGDIAAGAAPIQLTLAAPGNFTTPNLRLIHQSRSGAVAVSADSVPFIVDGVTALLATNRLTVTSGMGVTNWLGQYLQGGGGSTSCLYQVISAGSNGVPDLPSLTGQVSGDDRVLYAEGTGFPWGRFGEGAAIPANHGRFLKAFNHGEASGTRVYVRAWDASSFEGSVAYGDSLMYTLTAAIDQTHDFGSWLVGQPLDSGRDRNGDGILDAFCVTNNMDPRLPIAGLTSSWSLAQAPLGSFGIGPEQFGGAWPSPTRLFYKGDYMYVLDSGNSRIQVWNRLTREYRGAYGTNGTANGAFKLPVGLGLDPNSNRFAVADQQNSRIQLFSFDAATGTNITYLSKFGSTNTNSPTYLQKPTDVAIGTNGEIYVTDERVGVTNVTFELGGWPFQVQRSVDLSVVQAFTASGTYLRTLAVSGTNAGTVYKPGGVCVAPDGTVIVADTENNRIQAFTAAGTLLWPTNGANTVSSSKPRGVQVGLNGRIYVADTDNSRITILRSNGTFIATLGTQGSQFSLVMNHPYGLMPVVESNIVYVADTLNNRVLTVAPIYDGDQDGMDDIWEELHGLDPNNPNDGLLDANGNGVPNVGEYRLMQDPGAAEVISLPVRITAFTVNPALLQWDVVTNGGIYQVEYSQDSTSIASNSWTAGPIYTSAVNGTLSVATGLTLTNRVQYIRVKRLSP